ncbi:glutathione S-transferase family protein [Reyranella massiliensis]|uniref:glutathione S-transferase family protein n=1 Tax=Reyranella massiliensis TaxID=445220 RepID=UPI0002E38A2B|nr:glutathione S-transferase family protein [Reyranella massiliensis]
MADLILHHYPTSPFSEKVRVAFGLKKLGWKSVTIPNIMPKPDLMPLTGGYRKTPVLQVGADIYCDTQLIMLEIEKRVPTPPLLPPGKEGEARALAMWIDRNIFWAAVGVVMGAIGDKLPEAFHRDRSEFSGRSFEPAKLKAAAPFAAQQTYAQLVLAEEMLGDGRAYLLGAAPSLADCALYNPVWFIKERLGGGKVVPPLDRLPRLTAWSERMKAIGSGNPTEMSSADALAVAKAAKPAACSVDAGDPSGLKAGQTISVTPDDTGKVPVTGTLVGLTPDRISIGRNDERAGDVVVHFPRAGFIVTPA